MNFCKNAVMCLECTAFDACQDLLCNLWNSQHNITLKCCDVMNNVTSHACAAGHMTYD